MGTPLRAALLAAALVAPLLAGCDDALPSDAPALAVGTEGTTAAANPSEVNRDLAALRRLVAPFHSFDRARDAGWSEPITPCLELPGVGGMGFHYGNPAYIFDGGAVNVLEPELLLFEPQRNGQMRFVGVEYVVLFSDRGPDEDPPVLFGHEFHPVPDAGLWGLHVWVGRNNPSGMFADWNPLVSCRYAPPPAP